MLHVDMRKANSSPGGTLSRYQSNKIKQLLGEETIIHSDLVLLFREGRVYTLLGKLAQPRQLRDRLIKFILKQNYVQHLPSTQSGLRVEFTISFN